MPASLIDRFYAERLGVSGVVTGADMVALVSDALQVTTEPLYQYETIWAEESGALNANTTEWSFGNGAVGNIGIPVGDGWEVTEVFFQADVYEAATSITVAVHDYQAGANDVAEDLATVSLASSTDGGGQANNAYKNEVLATPVAVPSGAVIGFTTRAFNGTASDARVGCRMRRQVGDYVSGVTIT